jgi:hypothetical protein
VRRGAGKHDADAAAFPAQTVPPESKTTWERARDQAAERGN